MVGNPRRNALFGVVLETRGLRRLGGGVRSQMRTGLPVNWPKTANFTGKTVILGFGNRPLEPEARLPPPLLR